MRDRLVIPLTPHLTPQRRDVTNTVIAYAKPKNFVFISKRQMRWIDANRWYRQSLRDTKLISVHDLQTKQFSIDNRLARPLKQKKFSWSIAPIPAIRQWATRATKLFDKVA
jgi:hypothetical protein